MWILRYASVLNRLCLLLTLQASFLVVVWRLVFGTGTEDFQSVWFVLKRSCAVVCSVQFSSVPWPIGSSGGHKGRFIIQRSSPSPFCKRSLWAVSVVGRELYSLMLSIQHFLCRQRRRPPSKVPREMVLERFSWCVTCPNHASFRLLTVARRGSCGPTRKLI